MKQQKHSVQVDMLHGSLLDKILLFAIPLAASSILQQLFNSADIAVVGRFAGSNALAAVGSNSSVITLLINLFVGISVGANVVIANFIGQGKTEQVQEAVHTVMTMAIMSGVLLLLCGQLIARPILTLMNTPEEVLTPAVLYLRIYFLGMPFFMVYNFGASILRSIGDTKRPLFCLLISGVVNVCLNLFLVIVFHLGVAGVAIATVISFVVSSGLIIYFLTYEDEMIQLHIKQLSLSKYYFSRVIRIGAPAGIQGMVFSLSNVCIQTAINGFGQNAIAGSAAAVNFEFFTYFVTSAFSQAAVTFTSQNYGARLYGRCKKVFLISELSGMLLTGLMSITFVLGREFFIRFYTIDPEVIRFALIRMTHVEILTCLPVTYEVGAAALRGMGHSLLPAVLTVIGSCGFRIAWVYFIFPHYASFEALMNVYLVSWILTGIMVLGTYFLICKKVFKIEKE